MTDHSNETLPETIRWERRGVTLKANDSIRRLLRREGYWEHLTGQAQGSSILNVELSVSAGTLASPYGANVSVEAFGETRSLHGYGATPEAAMEAVDQKWEELALRSCPWLKPAAVAPAAPESEADDELFYTTDDCDEYITETDVGDVIHDYLQKYEPEDWPAEIEIFAYRRAVVPEAFKREHALRLLSDLVDGLEEHYGDDDFYFDMENLGARRDPPLSGKPQTWETARAEKADRDLAAAFEAAKAFVETVVGLFKVGRLEEVKDERATPDTAKWVRENCPEWEKEPDVAAALARFDLVRSLTEQVALAAGDRGMAQAAEKIQDCMARAAGLPAERYCGCGDQLTTEEVGRCGRCDIEKAEPAERV